jgi:hypothetical protein
VPRAIRGSREQPGRLDLRACKVSRVSKVFRERLALKGIQVSRAHKVKQD